MTSKQQLYAVTLHTIYENISTIMQTVEGAATLMSILPVEKEEPVIADKKKYHYVGGKRFKGISGEDLIVEVLSSPKRIYNIQEVKNEFMRRGFSHSSAGAAISKMVQDKRVIYLGNGKYCLPGTTVEYGGSNAA